MIVSPILDRWVVNWARRTIRLGAVYDRQLENTAVFKFCCTIRLHIFLVILVHGFNLVSRLSAMCLSSRCLKLYTWPSLVTCRCLKLNQNLQHFDDPKLLLMVRKLRGSEWQFCVLPSTTSIMILWQTSIQIMLLSKQGVAKFRTNRIL